LKICIAVRKRPLGEKELNRKEFDAVSCLHPRFVSMLYKNVEKALNLRLFSSRVVIHDAKLRVDGLTKYLDNNEFAFDHTFGDNDSTENLYMHTAAPLIPYVIEGQGRATCFAYGQTGSGKTFTMQGIQQFAAEVLEKEYILHFQPFALIFLYLGSLCCYRRI